MEKFKERSELRGSDDF